MDVDISQDSFAFSDIVPPSHVSDLESFSDLEFSDTDSSLTLTESLRSHTHDGTEEHSDQDPPTAQDDRQSKDKDGESLCRGLQGLNDENIKEFLAAIEKTKAELELGSSSRGSGSLPATSSSNLEESSLGILNIESLQDLVGVEHLDAESEAGNRTLIGEDGEINVRGLDSNGDTEDLQFPAELNENSYMYHRKPKSQRERTLEARPDTGQNPDEFFNPSNCNQEESSQELPQGDENSLGFSNNSEELNMMLLTRSGSADGGELIDRVSLTSTISFIQSQTFPDSIFSQSLSSTSRGLGSGMDSGSESDTVTDLVSGLPVAHTSGDGSNGSDTHSRLAVSRQAPGGISGNGGASSQHLAVVRPGLEGGNSEAEDDGVQLNTQAPGVGMETVPGSLGLRQSAEGDDVVPDLPGDGGGGGDGSSGSDSEDNAGPAGAAYASSSSSTVPSRTPSQGAHSNDLLHQLGLAAPWHGTVGVSLHQGDGQHSSGGDRQQPVGHGAGDVSTPVPGTIVNNQQLDGLGDISARSLGLFEFQAASTPMVRQQGDEATDDSTPVTSEQSALGAQYLLASNTPHSGSSFSSVDTPVWAHNNGNFQYSQVVGPNQEGSGQNLTLVGAPSLVFEPTVVGQPLTPRHQDGDQTLHAAGSTVPRASNRQPDHFLGGSFLSATNEDSQLWKSTPRDEESSRLTPGVVFKGDTKPSPVMEGQEWNRQVGSSRGADDYNATLKSVAVVRPDAQSTAFTKNNIWQNATDVSSGLASSGEFSSLLNRLAIEVPPADRTLTPGRTSAAGLPFQSSSNPFAATFDRDWQNQGGHFEDTLINRRNPFDSEDQGFAWSAGDDVADFSDFAVQGNAADILAADEKIFQEEHQFDHVASPTEADISKGRDWTILDESQYVVRRSLPVYGVNDPNDRGEVRISFGAFLAAGSEELGDLTSKDPDRARPHFGRNMPVNTPPPHTPYESYAPTPVPDISPTNFVQGQSPPAPSIQESPAVLAVQRETPVTVKKQPRQSGKQMVHAPYEREGQLKGDAEREKKEGRNQGAPAHYQGQDQRSFDAYKSSLDEQYKRDLCRRSRSSRGSSHSSSSSSKSSSHVSVQSVISNKENGSQQKQGSTEDKNQRDKKRRHSERSHTKRKVSKEDSRRCRNNATALQSGFTMSKQRGASHETLQDQVNDPSNVGFDSGLARTASSSLTSLLSSSTDISTMSHYEVAVLIANAVDADPEEISKMLVAAAKAKTKLKSRTLLSKQGEAEQQQVEKESVFRNTSSNGKTLAEVRRIRNEPTRSQNMNTQPLSDEREPVASGREVGGSPSSCKTSPFKPSSTSSPQFPFSSEGNPQSLSNTVFSSPTEIHNRNTQPNLSSYNLTNSSLEASVFSSNNPEDVHSARKTQYSKPTVIASAATEAVELVPKFGKTYTVRELPEAVPAVCERKQRLQNIPHDAELNLFDLQGNMSVVSEASPVNVSLNRSLAKHEFGLENDNLHTTREENNKQFLPRDQTDAADYNRPGTNPGSVQNNKGYTAQVGERMSQGDVQVKGLPPQVDISYGTAVSRAYNMQHLNPSPNTQMPNQGFPYRGTQQLYVNTNPSPLGMPVAQQPPYPVNNYPDHVMIPSGHQLPTPIGPVAMPQFPPHLYGPGNIPLGATVPQMPNYALVGGLPFQHPSVQTVSAGIGPRTSSLVTAFSHAVNTVGTPPFIQTAPPGLLQTGLQQGHPAGGAELVSGRTAPFTSVIVPEGATFPAVCCAGVSTPSLFPLHNSSGRWMQCEVKVALCTFNGVQVPNPDEGPFIIQPKIIIAPYSTENIKIKFEPRNAGVYSAQIQVFPSPVVPEAQTGTKLTEPSVPCLVSMEIVAEEPKVEILPEDSQALEFGEMTGGKKKSRALRLMNHGRASVPVRIIISANAASLHCFSFANADSSPRRSSTSPSKALSSSGAGLCIQTLTLMGQVDTNVKVEPTVVWLLFQAPSQGKGSTADPVGPPDTFSARVDVEIDSVGQGPTVGSVLLKANVGIVRLHTPHRLQAISLSGTAGQRVSRALPLRNAGNIAFQAELKVDRDPEYFNITPDRVMLKPGQGIEVHVHFRATKPNVVVDSSLSIAVLPDGPYYEMILRGSSTSDKQTQQESDILMCNKPVVCWGGVGIGRAVQQKLIIRNQSKTPTKILQLQLSIQGNHSDFQIVNSFGSSDEKTSTHMVKLPSQEELVVHLLFAPSSMGLISSALVIRTPATGIKSKVPLHGCGGTSHLVIVDAKKPTERSDYLADIGEVSLGNTNVTKLTIRNTGTRAAFVKAICYSDMQSRALYPATHLSIAPNDFVIPERSSKQVVIVYQPMEKDALKCRQEVSTVATIAFYTGDENIRAQYKRHIKQQAKPYSEVAVTGSLTGINFITAFQGEDKLLEDAVYPQVANWDQFFQSCVTRMLLLLVGLPPQSAKQDNPRPVNELPMPNTAVPPTPARKLPADAKPSITRNGNTERWTVIPEHVVLTAPRSGNEKGTERIQLVNFSERALGFEFIWPAHSLVLTPDRGQIPPRSQVMVIMSTKPSLALSGIDLPWGGTVYVQCDGTQKAVRVQIREDLVLENSPYQPGSNTLQSLSPNTALVTPYNPLLPTSHLPSLRVDPKVISFDETHTGKTAASAISLTNDGTAVLKWNMSSVAPAYVKAQDNTGDIFRTTYSVFHITRHSGTLAPGDTVKVAARFQPRDAGVYSQHWDIQAKDEDSKQPVKAKIELTGQALKKLSSSDEVQLTDTLPLHQPPSKDVHATQRATANTSRKSSKHPAGVYLENETLEFPDTAVGQTSELRMKLCNNSNESQLVKLIDPKLPFSITHHKVKLNPHRFVRVPVKFTPSKLSESFKSQLAVNTDKGQKLLILLVGSSTGLQT